MSNDKIFKPLNEPIILASSQENYQVGNTLQKENKLQEALDAFLKSANESHPRAYLRLADLYKGNSGIPKNQKLSDFYYQKAAECFEWFKAEAQNALNPKITRTRGERKTPEANPVALFNLGECYEYGLGVKQDFIEAIKYYHLASIKNDSMAAYNLGVLYEKRLSNIPESLESAITCYRLAAEQGSCWAQNRLGDHF